MEKYYLSCPKMSLKLDTKNPPVYLYVFLAKKPPKSTLFMIYVFPPMHLICHLESTCTLLIINIPSDQIDPLLNAQPFNHTQLHLVQQYIMEENVPSKLSSAYKLLYEC